MSDYSRACPVADVPEGTAVRCVIEGEAVAVVHTEGEFYAIRDECSHAAIALSEGDVDGCLIECWLHGSTFDLRTGKPTGPPATEPVPIYPVKIDGNDVLIDLGDN